MLQDLNATTEIVGINLLHHENLEQQVNGLKEKAWFVRFLSQIHGICEKHKKMLYDVKHSLPVKGFLLLLKMQFISIFILFVF